MKKVLVAGAALMLAGSANAGVKNASVDAGVTISGAAQVTYVGQSDYLRDAAKADQYNGYSDYFESRISLDFEAKSQSGIKVKAGMYFDDYKYYDDAIWEGVEKDSVTVDYAYFAVPMGPVTIEAGRMPLSFTKFYSWDIRPTRVRAVYKSGNFTIIPFVGVVSETADSGMDNWDDNDFMQYGIVPIVNINGWTLKAFMRYNDDAQEWDSAHNVVSVNVTDPDGSNPRQMLIPEGDADGSRIDVGGGLSAPGMQFAQALTPSNDRSGFDGNFHINNYGATNSVIGFEAEVAYMSADFQQKEDDGIGGYVQFSKKLGAFTPAVLAGMTQDGFEADKHFGFVMVGGDESTTVVKKVGNPDGELFFAAFVANYAITPQLNLTGNLLYADYDNNTEGRVTDAIEVSGAASYALSSGASLTYKAGYLATNFDDDVDALDDAYFGHMLQLELAF